MRVAFVFGAIVTVLCEVGLPAQTADERTVGLKQIDLEKAPLRAGFDLTGKRIPRSGWQAKVGPQTFVFLDLDGDGKLAPGVDGVGMQPYPFAVPLPAVLVCNTGQYDVTFDGTKSLVLKKQKLGVIDRWSGDASLLNDLRIRAGVRMITIHPEESAACEKHCDYLKANKMADGTGGMKVHEESASKPGYTPEGETAARKSCLAFAKQNLRDALLEWCATAWHGSPIVDPDVTRFAAALKNGVAMFYPCDKEPSAVKEPMHPADGATEIPLAFASAGEMPNPVAGTQNAMGCGFPIFLRVSGRDALKKAIITDPKGVQLTGNLSCPKNPANKDWPTNSALALFIPVRPLEPKTKYSVRFEFADGKKVDWSFTTAAK